MSELFLYYWMHSNSFRLQVLMSLLLSHLYACMRIIHMYDHPPNFDTNPRSKKKHKTLENTGQPHQTRVHGGGVPYIYIYTQCMNDMTRLEGPAPANPQRNGAPLNRSALLGCARSSRWAGTSARGDLPRRYTRAPLFACPKKGLKLGLVHVFHET